MKNINIVDVMLHSFQTRRKRKLHFINPVYNVHGGSAQRIKEIGRILSDDFEAVLWVGETQHATPDELKTIGMRIRKIAPRRLSFPRNGVILIVGIYFWIGNWIRFSYADKVVVLINTPPNGKVIERIERIRNLAGREKVIVVVAAQWISNSLGLKCTTLPSPVDLSRFYPKPQEDLRDEQSLRPFTRTFTIGRLSRDVYYKHHPDDGDLYLQLARLGFNIRIMGASIFRDQLANVPGIEILKEGSMAPEEFLRSLDVFIYRTDPRWIEPHGRVIHEAMATGIPIIWGPKGGFVEWLEPLKHGFQFFNNEEAIAALKTLQADKSLTRNMGEQCRADVEVALSDRAVRETLMSLIEAG